MDFRIFLLLTCLFAFDLSASPEEHKKFRILSLDGGGVRGIMQVEFLRALEEKTGLRAQDQFHMFAGTSIGGINALALSAGHSVNDMSKLYEGDAKEIFYASYWRSFWSMGGYLYERYSPDGLEKVLKYGFKGYRTSDLQYNLGMVVTQNTGIDKPQVIRSWEALAPWSHTKAIDASKNIKLWRAARATSAAPSYFPPCLAKYQDGHTDTLIDGGLIANNPSEIALTAAETIINRGNLKHTPDNIEVCLYSLGTGDFSDRFTYQSMKTTGALGWISPVIYIATSDKITDEQMGQRLDKSRYFRFNPKLPIKDDQIDNTDPKFRESLREAARKSIASYDRWDELCQSLSTKRDVLW